MTWHPKPSLTVELYTGPQATWIPCLSSLPPDSGTLISKGNAKFTFIREHNFGPLSAAVFTVFLSLAQARCFWRCLLFKSGLTQGMRQLKPMSCIRLCVVVLEALTPAAVHSLWISPTFLNGFVSLLSRVRLSLLLVHFFYQSFPSLRLYLMAWTRALWTSSLFCHDLLCLALLVQGVNGVFWTQTVKSAVFPWLCSLQTTERPFKGLCRCFELISWLECGPGVFNIEPFHNIHFLRYWIWGFH